MVLNRRRVWKIIRIVWVTLGVASIFVLWFGMTTVDLPPDTFTSDARVEIVRGIQSIDFRPRPDNPKQTGLIFFPGGLVAPESYAPMARRLAEQGHPVSIVRLPYHMAPTPAYQAMVFETARDTMAASPRPWVVGGHSRGAMLATRFAYSHPARIAGLALVGTTHPREIDLSGLSVCVPVIKISGTRDGVARQSESEKFRHNLPPHTGYVQIEGGNHTQFGYYRYQLLDKRASIDRETQQRLVIEGLLMVLRPQGRPDCL
ncbi:MAG: alpha/beta hydrolase [Vicinamibacterales bacterium]